MGGERVRGGGWVMIGWRVSVRVECEWVESECEGVGDEWVGVYGHV